MLAHFLRIALAVFLLFAEGFHVVSASSWNPTLLVNSESFQIIDEGDSSTDVYLQFGDTLGETMGYDRTAGMFSFSESVAIQGSLTASGNLVINDDADAADATLTFGNSIGNQVLTYSHIDQVFDFSNHVRISNGTLAITDLPNCDTIDSTSTGMLLCGSDGAVFETDHAEVTMDYDTLTGSTIRLLSSTSSNRPSDSPYIVTTVGTGTVLEQRALSGATMYTRTYLDGTWNSWELLVSEITAAEIAQSFDDIDKNVVLAESGDGARTIKVCPVGTNISTQVVSHADGNVVYRRPAGSNTYSVLARLDKHEVHTFTANQGDRIYSIKGDSVASNAFGTVAWMSMALAGEEFFTYVARNATVADPAHLYIATFGVGADITILQNGSAYDTLTMQANSITDVDLDTIAEYQITSDQPITLWYVANNDTTDAKPLPPVSSDLMWFNTAFSAAWTPRISALYSNTNITVNYTDGSQETALVQPGSPFQLQYDAGYAQYGGSGAAIITADGIISGANAADGDGNNGTAWYSSTVAAQHFFLPVSAQHISFVCLYETDIIVRNTADAVNTTLRAVRANSVSADQSYPAAVKWTPGFDIEGYSFEAGVPCSAVFDSSEAGLAGDETVLLGGALPYTPNPIYQDITTGQQVQLQIDSGAVTVNGL